MIFKLKYTSNIEEAKVNGIFNGGRFCFDAVSNVTPAVLYHNALYSIVVFSNAMNTIVSQKFNIKFSRQLILISCQECAMLAQMVFTLCHILLFVPS